MNNEPRTTAQLDLLLLSVIARGPAHGYLIIEELRRRSAGAFDLLEGTVYPALYRLERLKLVASRADVVSGRRRRVYRITPAGRSERDARQRLWERMAQAVAAVIEGKPRHAKA